MSTSTVYEIAKQFFDLYRAQNVPEMVNLFAKNGEVEYVPFNMKGPVEEIGPGSWGVLIDAFPNLSNHVLNIQTDALGRNAFIDVNISGTQQKEAFGVPSLGRTYDLRHFFILTINEYDKIVKLTSFWDNASWYEQLGKTNL